MFYYLDGTVAEILPGLAVIDCGGVGYACMTTNNTLSQLKKGEKKKLYTYLNVGESIFDLYGFATQNELNSFKLLLGVSGVGPKAALAILSANTPEGLAMAIVTEDAKSLFDVNFFGMVNMNRQVVPIMREAGHGRIVNLSSVAAPVPIPFQTYYSATKAAVNAYTMALANELRPFGVTVCAVMPGDIHTGFTAARRKIGEGDDIYQGRIGRSVARMEHDEKTGMDPTRAGGYVARVALREGSHHPLYAIRIDYKFFVFLTKVLPAGALNRLVYLIYGK